MKIKSGVIHFSKTSIGQRWSCGVLNHRLGLKLYVYRFVVFDFFSFVSNLLIYLMKLVVRVEFVVSQLW